MKQGNIEIEDIFTGKLGKLKNGDIIILRRSKNGKIYRYTMRPARGKRTPNQIGNNNTFRRAANETTRQLKVRATRLRWEVSYRASDGVYHGKKYHTLRGFVFASCFNEVVKASSESDDGG